MGLQFVRIFLFLSCHPRSLPSFPSPPFLAFFYLAGAKGNSRLQCHTSFSVGAYQLNALLGFGIAAPVLFIPADLPILRSYKPAKHLAIPQFQAPDSLLLRGLSMHSWYSKASLVFLKETLWRAATFFWRWSPRELVWWLLPGLNCQGLLTLLLISSFFGIQCFLLNKAQATGLSALQSERWIESNQALFLCFLWAVWGILSVNSFSLKHFS